MPSPASGSFHGQALLDFVQHGSFPDSEEIISAELSPTIIPAIVKSLAEARHNIKVFMSLATFFSCVRFDLTIFKANIQALSVDSAPDTEGWITQAEQLRHDIELSHDTSEHIVHGATELEKLRSGSDDALQKVALLKGELTFTKTLVSVFGRIAKLRNSLEILQTAIIEDRIVEIPGLLVDTEIEFEGIRDQYAMRAVAILKEKLGTLRTDIGDRLLHDWNMLLFIDSSSATFKAQQEIKRMHYSNYNGSY